MNNTIKNFSLENLNKVRNEGIFKDIISEIDPFFESGIILGFYLLKGINEDITYSEYKERLKSINLENAKDFARLTHFYTGHTYVETGINTPEEFKFLVIISVIEKSMSNKKYLTPFNYISKLLKKNLDLLSLNKENLGKIKEDYEEIYGIARKFTTFFKENLEDYEYKFLEDKLEGVKDFTKHLYDLRSQFIHEANFLHVFKREEVIFSIYKKKNKVITSEMTFSNFRGCFEKAFLRKYKLLN
jgi:hypothetical protein